MNTQNRSGRGGRLRLASLSLGALLFGSAIACGGSTTGGHAEPAGSAGSDGDRDAGSGAGGSGGGAGGSGSGGTNGSSGGSHPGGAGGATCECPAIGCGPGFHSVNVPGQCCPSCEVCTVDCPAIECAAGEMPLTLPGQCCPTECAPAPQDAGVYAPTCTTIPVLACRSQRQCPADWRTARSRFATCDPPPTLATYLAVCGRYHVLVSAGFDAATRYFYDEYGKLVAEDADYAGALSCNRLDASFRDPGFVDCTFEPNCGVGGDAGPPACGDGVLDPGESCDRIVGEQTCASATQGALGAGTLKCTADCTFDVSGCHH